MKGGVPFVDEIERVPDQGLISLSLRAPTIVSPMKFGFDSSVVSKRRDAILDLVNAVATYGKASGHHVLAVSATGVAEEGQRWQIGLRERILHSMEAKPQHEKFKELARELECDEDEKAFEETVKRIAPKDPGAQEQGDG